MEHVLYLEDKDDIASIRGRIDVAFPPPDTTNYDPAAGRVNTIEKKRLLLVIPRKNKDLGSLVNMKLLARISKTKAIETAVVSNQSLVRDYAKEAGIKAYSSLQMAKRFGWVAKNAPVSKTEETLPPILRPELGKSEPQTKLTKKQPKKSKYVVVQGTGRVNLFQQFGLLIAMVALAIAFVFGIVALLPQATVTLTPVAQSVEASLVVTADPENDSVDFQTLTFPAWVDQVELELSGQIETANTELAPVGRATGIVTFINRTEEEQTIPISTTISTSAGEAIEFLTAQTTTIPAGTGATTPTLVIAVEPGPQGNVAAAQINRFVDSSFGLLARPINEQPLGGGTMESANIVVQDDKERLQAHLRQQVLQEGLQQLQDKVGEQEFIPPETLQVIVLDVTYNEFSGDFSDTFSGEMQAVIRGTVVSGFNANRLALAALEAQVPPDFELDVEGLHFASGEILDIQDQSVVFKIFADGIVQPVIDDNDVAQAVAWLPIGEAQATLSQQYELATVPGIELNPDWLVETIGRLPYIPLRIEVIVNEAVILMAEGN
ncbi:MAG: hypothetical protein AAF485_15240 [Chloroflexota bacterium]